MTRYDAMVARSEYHSRVTPAFLIYAAGAAVALWRTDALWPTRILLSLLWPAGPLAFVLTVSLLLAASLIAFPLWGAVVAAVALGWWFL